MSIKPLSDLIQPQQLVEQEAVLQGYIHVADLHRLADLLYDNQGQVEVKLRFGRDEDGLSVIKGSLYSNLSLLCQRCMQPFSFILDVPLNLALVTNELALKNLPKYYDPLLVSREPMSLRDIIEEELLLNLPLVAKHEQESCSIKLQNLSEKGDNTPK